MTERTDQEPIPFGGINHLALVSSDMAATVDFYEGVLGMPLVKTVALPNDFGQHFFFDCGGGNQLAFFWFPQGPGPAPGIAAPAHRPDTGNAASAVGSMNHVAFSVPADEIDRCRERLVERGIECSDVFNHDDSEWGVARDLHDGVFVRSIYFNGPDGELLELAATTRPFGPDDIAHEPESPA